MAIVLDQWHLRAAPFHILSPGKMISVAFIFHCAFDGVAGSGLHYPFEVLLANTGAVSIGGGVAEIDGVRDIVPYGQFNRVEIISEIFIDAEYNIGHFLQPLRRWCEVDHVTQVMRIAWFVWHDLHVFSTDTITAVIFLKYDLFLEQHNQLTCFIMLLKTLIRTVQLVHVLPSSACKWFHVSGKTNILKD